MPLFQPRVIDVGEEYEKAKPFDGVVGVGAVGRHTVKVDDATGDVSPAAFVYVSVHVYAPTLRPDSDTDVALDDSCCVAWPETVRVKCSGPDVHGLPGDASDHDSVGDVVKTVDPPVGDSSCGVDGAVATQGVRMTNCHCVVTTLCSALTEDTRHVYVPGLRPETSCASAGTCAH